MVDGVIGPAGARQNELAYGDNLIALAQQSVQDARQGLGGVEGGVVEENDGAGPDALGHALGDGGGVVFFPVQAVPPGSGWRGMPSWDIA